MGQDEITLNVRMMKKTNLVITETEERVTDITECETLSCEALHDLVLQTFNQLHGFLEHASERVSD